MALYDEPGEVQPTTSQQVRGRDGLTRRERKELRINELVDGCRDELIAGIAAPFGLDPSIFVPLDPPSARLAAMQPQPIDIKKPGSRSVWNDKRTIREHGDSTIPTPIRTIAAGAAHEVKATSKFIEKELRAAYKDEKISLQAAFKEKTDSLQQLKINGLDQAIGWAVGEFANGATFEIKTLMTAAPTAESMVDKLIAGMKRQITRIKARFLEIVKGALQGGLDQFIGKLFGYLMNMLLKSFKKFGALIRDSAGKLLAVVKEVINPPAHLTGAEVARKATKSVAAIVLAALGVLFEQSITAFVASVPLLTPFAGTLGTVITTVLTGLSAALVMFWIDKFFDWLESSGTEHLEAQITHLEASKSILVQSASLWEQQIANSSAYARMVQSYSDIEEDMRQCSKSLEIETAAKEVVIHRQTETVSNLQEILNAGRSSDDEIEALMKQYLTS